MRFSGNPHKKCRFCRNLHFFWDFPEYLEIQRSKSRIFARSDPCGHVKVYQNLKKSDFHIFELITRFSKCDFWNLGEIWDRNRWPIFFLDEKIFVEKNPKTFGRKTFWDQNFSIVCRFFFVEKVNENSKFRNFENVSIFFEIWFWVDDFKWTVLEVYQAVFNNFWSFVKLKCSTLYFSTSETCRFGFWGSARPKSSLASPNRSKTSPEG